MTATPGRSRRLGELPRTPVRPSGEMNVTPLIDVLLVLLVIFMAALPLMQKGLDVSVPGEVRPPSKTLYIIGAGSRPYRDVVAVVDAAKGAGVQRVGIVTESMRESG